MKKILILTLFLSAFSLQAQSASNEALAANLKENKTQNSSQNYSDLKELDTDELSQINASKESEKDAGVFALVQKYLALQEDLQGLNQKSDNNQSLFLGEKNALKSQKQALLLQIPSAISAQKVDERLVNQFLEHKKSLENELKKQEKKQDFNYAKLRIEYANLELNEQFFSALLKLQNLFKQTASAQELKASIVQGQNAIEAVSQFSLNEQKLNDTQKVQIQALLSELELKKGAYEEILKYLLDNANLFESNFIFSELRLQDGIDKLNAHIPSFGFLNSGKIIICALILLFFYGVKILLLKGFFLFLVKLFYRNANSNFSKEDIKNIFIEKGRKPFSFILFFYALSVCLTVIYYPAPVNIGFINALYIAYAVFVAWLIISMLDSYGIILLSKIAQKSGRKEVANLIIKISYLVVIIIAALFILAHLGFNVSAIIASLGIGGLAVALAAKDIIANFFASLIVSFDDSFNQGDWIEVGGVNGIVVETGLRKTIIRTFDNSLVFLPNSTIMSANITNWSKRKIGRHIKMILGVAYDAKPEQLAKCVQDLKEYLHQSPLVAQESDNALEYGDYRAKYRQNLVSINDLEGYKNAIYVSLCEFADSSINIELYFYTKAVGAQDFREARQVLMLDFMRILDKNGLGFAFPSLSIYVENLKELKNMEKSNFDANLKDLKDFKES